MTGDGGSAAAVKSVCSQVRVEIPANLRRILREALDNPEGFWSQVAEELHWFRRWDKVLEWNFPDFAWFKGGVTNLAYNCLERNLEKGRVTIQH